MPVMGPDIYAAGDAVQVKHYVTGNDTLEDMDKISKDKNAVLLDVRTVGEFSRGHINGFKNIPVDELRERINEVEKEKPVYLICIFRKNCASIPIQVEQSLAD